MRALVTGAVGFVGVYLVQELCGAGYEVLATDIVTRCGQTDEDEGSGAATGTGSGVDEVPGMGNGSAPERLPDGVPYRRCDLLEAEAVDDMITASAPEVVFHLAAQSSAARSFEDPEETLRVNLFGTLHLLEALRRRTAAGELRFVSVGSCEEYGNRSSDEMPITESSPIEPVSPYAVSKAAQHTLAMQYWRVYGISVIATRSFSHTGPGQPDRFVLPAFARQCAEIAAGLREPLIRVGNLEVTRDFLDVRDVVAAYRLLAERGEPGAVYNVCSGEGLGLRAALDVFVGRVSGDVRIEIDPDRFRPADIPVLVGSNARLCGQTGWRRTITAVRMLTDLADYWERRVHREAGEARG
jgi:GDP-4-dehydro-6-deoxy-D-mannose reductase